MGVGLSMMASHMTTPTCRRSDNTHVQMKRGMQKIGQGRDAARKRAGAEFRKPALSRVRGPSSEFVHKFTNLRAKAEMAPQAACVHEGGGVERRAAHHERERQRRLREAAGGSTEPAAEEATDVEAVSAADVLAGVEESGPNYALPTAREGQRERRERLRVDARRSDKIC